MRKAIAGGVLGCGLLLASGCTGGDAASPEPGPQPEPTSDAPSRSGPAKSVELADKCAIVTEEQASALGADQQPRPRDSNGISGCQYQLGESAAGWAMFVAGRGESFKSVVESDVLTDPVDVAGYPGAQFGDDQNCLTAVDVSDKGTLWLNGQVLDGSADPCQLSVEFAKAAIKNLPDAPGGQ